MCGHVFGDGAGGVGGARKRRGRTSLSLAALVVEASNKASSSFIMPKAIQVLSSALATQVRGSKGEGGGLVSIRIHQITHTD